MVGNVECYEMYCIFNCGVGMIIVLFVSEVDKVFVLLNVNGENVWKIGIIKVFDFE